MSERRLAAATLACLLVGVGACGPSGPSTPLNPSSPAPAADPPSSDWPMYGHDAARTSYNAGEKTINASNVSRLVQHWQAFIGIGDYPSSSAPTVAGGRVYVGSSAAEGDNFFCFDAATGRQLWTADVGRVPVFDLDVGIGATAAVSAGVVAAGGGDAAYYALDAQSGEILWRHPLDVGPSGFAWASPLIAAGHVYVGASSEGDNPPVRGELRALDLQDGSILARQFFVPDGVAGAGIWNSPTLTPDGSVLVVATGEDNGSGDPYSQAIVSLDPATLQILDADKEGGASPGQDLDFGTSPVILHDRAGRILVGANHKSGVFYAYDLAHLGSGPIWQRATGLSIGMMPGYDPTVGEGGTLFIVGDNGLLFSVDPATGADRWGPAVVGFMYGNMALANGLVFVASGGGVTILDANTGAFLGTLRSPNAGPTYTGVVVAGGAVYWVSGAYLNAWGLP